MIEQPKHLVSIITPTFNSAQYIDQCIASVLSQTYTNWELIITDDFSQDNTIDIIQKYVDSDSRIKLFSLSKNGGPGVARNNSIKNANGSFIAFLDSDDQWMSTKLEKQLNFMLMHDLALSYTSYDVIDDEEGTVIRTVIAKGEVTIGDMLKSNYIGCSTAIYNVDKLGKVYMPLIRKRQDYGLWIEIIKKTKVTKGLKESLTKYMVRGNSVSSNKFKLISYQWEFYNDVLGLNFFMSVRSIIYWFVYSLLGIKNKGK